MHPDPARRLGGTESDATPLKNHPFFQTVDWAALSEKRVTPPFKPTVKNEKDTSNIDKAFLIERPVDSPTTKMLTFS